MPGVSYSTCVLPLEMEHSFVKCRETKLHTIVVLKTSANAFSRRSI